VPRRRRYDYHRQYRRHLIADTGSTSPTVDHEPTPVRPRLLSAARAPATSAWRAAAVNHGPPAKYLVSKPDVSGTPNLWTGVTQSVHIS
jgi:hypothetical protein